MRNGKGRQELKAVDKSDSSRDTEGHAAIPGAARSCELGLTPTKCWGRSSAAGRGGSTPCAGLGRGIAALPDSGDQPRTTTRRDSGSGLVPQPRTHSLCSSPGGDPRGPGSGPPAAAAPRLLKRSLATKDTHVCIKLLGSQSNSGTSDSNYRCITGADKSAARQPGTCQCSAADAAWGAEQGEGLRLLPPVPALLQGQLWAALGTPTPSGPPNPPSPRGQHPTAVLRGCSSTHGAWHPAVSGWGRGTSSCPSLPQHSLCSLWGGPVPKTPAGSGPDPCSAWPGCPGQPPVLLQQSEKQRRDHPQLPAAARKPGYGSRPGGASGWAALTTPGKGGGCWLAGFRSKGETHVREKQ